MSNKSTLRTTAIEVMAAMHRPRSNPPGEMYAEIFIAMLAVAPNPLAKATAP